VARCSGPRFSPLGNWNLVPAAAVQEQLRRAFARWGLPNRVRVDNGTPWGSTGDFPTELSLWLIGLGIDMHWNSPRSPQENGVVERSQGTSNRWCEPRTCATAQELQERLDRMDKLHRELYPYRERLSRMAYFPGLQHSGRPYDRGSEPALWEWSRVTEHLSTYLITRQVDRAGLVSLYNRGRYVGKIHHGKRVYVMYDPERNEWFFTDIEGRQLRRQPAEELTQERVVNLNVTHRP
jgi:transposase InsO family protein